MVENQLLCLLHQVLEIKDINPCDQGERSGVRSYLEVAEVSDYSLDSCWGVLHKTIYSFWVVLLQVSPDTVERNMAITGPVCIYTTPEKDI